MGIARSRSEPGIDSTDTLIRIRNLSKEYGAATGVVAALGPVDLTLTAGEFVSIVGPSGCGKSTLLRLVAGLEAPTDGRIEYELITDSERPFESMVFQGESTFPWLTVHENIEYGLRVRGVPPRIRSARVSEMLNTVGLVAFSEAYPYQLSGGMRQRVALARALANDPELLLMDEPFGALDEQNRILLQDELLRIWDRTEKTVLFVTHSIDEALLLSDRVLIMSAAPGRFVDEIRVPFSRPRALFDLKQDATFGRLAKEIWSRLKVEVEIVRGR